MYTVGVEFEAEFVTVLDGSLVWAGVNATVFLLPTRRPPEPSEMVWFWKISGVPPTERT